MENRMELKFSALSQNESFARATVAGFCLQANPTIDELTDVKTAVSEAVTNCIVHAYPKGKGDVLLTATIKDGTLTLTVRDHGVGIDDLDKARQPFYTTKPLEERSGMGFTVMESFMDTLKVTNAIGGGLEVMMTKTFKQEDADIASIG